jgi:YHS domain-containing protein
MANIDALTSRIEAEFSAVKAKVQAFQSRSLEEHKQREQRVIQLGKLFDELSTLWRPRLEILQKRFGDRVKVTPRIVPSTREAMFEFQSKVARVRLKFSATTDRDVKKIIVSYDLEILPVFIQFQPHTEVEYPLDAVDKEALASWMDDRIVEFVQTYLSMGENEIYLKDLMVEDPVAHVTFPNFVAGATLDWQGTKYYFLGEETRNEFAKQNKIAIA